LTAVWDEGSLRWISRDGLEVIRGIQLSARDRDWVALVPRMAELRIHQRVDGFELSFESRFNAPEFDVSCETLVRAESERLEVSVVARAHGYTLTQRLSLTILLPSALAGSPYGATSIGRDIAGEFPVAIDEGSIVSELRKLEWQPGPGLRAELAFDAPWEIEDQRNWSDASFKAYSPPLSRPHPYSLQAGGEFRQVVKLAVKEVRSGPKHRPRVPRPEDGHGIVVSESVLRALPPIGLGWSRRLDAGEAALVKDLQPAHLRVLVDPGDEHWLQNLTDVSADARIAGSSLLLEAVVDPDDSEVVELAQRLGGLTSTIVAVIAFDRRTLGGYVSTPQVVTRMREELRKVGLEVSVGAGSRAHYAQLIAHRAGVSVADFVAFPITPQVHAFDEATIVENLSTIPELVQGAARIAQPVDVLCTFRPRFNAYANPPEVDFSETRFDDRLQTEFGACWVIAVLAGLLADRSPLDRVTLLEAAGRAGVVQMEADGRPGRLVRILKSVLELSGSDVLECHAPAGFAALALHRGPLLRVFVANLLANRSAVQVWLPAAYGGSERLVDLGPGRYTIFDATVAPLNRAVAEDADRLDSPLVSNSQVRLPDG
jgi:hypothetical protein